jgi:putative transcriptional regulator
MRAALVAFLFAICVPLAGAADVDRPLVLVAKPGLRDPLYGSAVLVVAPLATGQHVGFIVNRPTDVTLGTLFPDDAASQMIVNPVYLGGPVGSQLIFALVQRKQSPGGNSFEVMPGVYAAFESAVVDQIIESDPQHARFVAGLVAWRPGELEAEIERGAWLVLEPDAAVVTRNPEGLWEELVRRSQRRRNTI